MNKPIDDSRVLRGMEKQFQLRRDRLNAGEKSIGWKVGFGAPASLERLKLDAPLVGFLTDKTILQTGAAVSVVGWTKPAVEPEIAVYMGADLSQSPDRETTKAAIASIGPSIELADVDFPPDNVETILAGNIYNRHVVLGVKDPSRAGCMLDGLIGKIYLDDDEYAVTEDPQLMTGDIVGIVSMVANTLSVFGEKLRKGDVIITGSIVPPLWVNTDVDFSYRLEPIDTVSICVQI
jgi:2-keto-4-pentenoate hydratase